MIFWRIPEEVPRIIPEGISDKPLEEFLKLFLKEFEKKCLRICRIASEGFSGTSRILPQDSLQSYLPLKIETLMRLTLK